MCRIVQILQLALTLLSVYGYIRFWMSAFRMKAELALPLAFVTIGLFTFASGLLGVLLQGSVLILLLGLVFAGMSFFGRSSIGRKYVYGNITDIFSPGTIAFCTMALFSVYTVIGHVFFNIDDFSHWATVVKVMLMNDSFPTQADGVVAFPHYPLGSSSLVYWFCRMTNIRSEWSQMLVQALLISSCLASMFSIAPRKRGLLSWASYAALGLFSAGVLCSNIELSSLFVDDLLAVLGLAGLAVWAGGRQDKRNIWPLLLICCYVAMVKESGAFFSLALILLVLADKNSPSGSWKRAVVLAAGLIVVELWWSWHVDTVFPPPETAEKAAGLLAVFPGLAGKTRDMIVNIAADMGRTVLSPAVLLPMAAAMLIALFLSRRCEHKKAMTKMIFASFALWVVYCVGQGLMYVFFMDWVDAVELSSFGRYFATIQAFTFGSLLMLVIYAASFVQLEDWKKLLSIGLCCAASIAVLRPTVNYLVRMEYLEPSYMAEEYATPDFMAALSKGQREYEAALRSEFDRVYAQYKIPTGMTYAIFVENYHGIRPLILCNYILLPKGACVITDGELDELAQRAMSMDYYIVLEPSEANMAFVEENFGSAERVGPTR